MNREIKRISNITAVLLVLSAVGGCASEDISKDLPPEAITFTSSPPIELKIETWPSKETTPALTTTGETSPSAVTTAEIPADTEWRQYYASDFSEEYNDFLSRCVFVGDSICRGLAAYDIIPAKRVVAQGNVAARNIFEFTFRVGGDEMTIIPALVDLKPEYVVFSMGMNDVNITSQETFCQNYGELLSQAESFIPNSKFIVLSVTPVLESSKFTSNENIDSFNEALEAYLADKENWTYVNIAPSIKNDKNALREGFSGEDGVHLAPDAYYDILYRLCQCMVGQQTDG